MKLNKLLKKIGSLSLSAVLALNIVTVTMPVSAEALTDTIYTDTIYIDETFDENAGPNITSYSSGYRTTGNNTHGGTHGNTRAQVDKANGALDGKSYKQTVSTTSTAQLRVGVAPASGTTPTLPADTPHWFSISFKFDSFGNADSASAVTILSRNLIAITSDGSVLKGNASSGTDTNLDLETGNWYTITGRYADSGMSAVVTLRDALTGKVLLDPLQYSWETAVGSATYFNFVMALGSTVYLDNLKLYNAEYFNGADSVSLSDESTLTLETTVWGNRVHFKVTDEATSDGVKDVACESVVVVRNGGEPYEASCTTHTDDSVRVVLGDEGGYYRIYAKITNGENTINAGFEWAIQPVGAVVVTEADGTLTASVHAPKGSLNTETYTLILAAYDADNNLAKAEVSEAVTTNSNSNTAYDLSASISDYSDYTVKAFLFDKEIRPKWSEVQILYTPETEE